MELLEQDLQRMLKTETNFSDMHLLHVVYNSLCSLAFLHEANVMHRDVKPANVLITPNCDVKLCDFGLSRTVPPDSMGLAEGNSVYLRESVLQKNQGDVSNKAGEEKCIAEELTKASSERNLKKRSMSVYVGTRWYRAPEIALLQKHCDQA